MKIKDIKPVFTFDTIVLLCGILLILLCSPVYASDNPISPEKIPSAPDLLQNLEPNIPGLAEIYQLRDAGKTDQAIQLLVAYLKQKSADRYYFNWKNFKQWFQYYRSQYPEQRQEHLELATEQMTTYPPETNWILPFKNLKGMSLLTSCGTWRGSRNPLIWR